MGENGGGKLETSVLKNNRKMVKKKDRIFSCFFVLAIVLGGYQIHL